MKTKNERRRGGRREEKEKEGEDEEEDEDEEEEQEEEEEEEEEKEKVNDGEYEKNSSYVARQSRPRVSSSGRPDESKGS